MTSKGSEDENGSGASRNSASSLAHNRSASKSWISTCGRAAGEEAVDSVTARISKATIPSVGHLDILVIDHGADLFPRQ